jgi:hypothetical protein
MAAAANKAQATPQAPELTTVASTIKEDQAKRDRHEQRKSWFIAEASRQSHNRMIMAKCEAYYDNEQYSHEVAQELRDRGQNPVVYNEVAPVIDWLIGTERRQRVDFYVVAEDDDEQSEDDARNKTKLLKYLDDVNRAGFERSRAAEDAFKAGVGWLEVGLRGDTTGVRVYVGAESWRNMLWDSLGGTKLDLSNSRYIFRIKVVDLDVAKALLPGNDTKLDAVAQVGDDTELFRNWMGGNGLIEGLDSFSGMDGQDDYMTTRPIDGFNPRKRVMLIECWSREPMVNKGPDKSMGDPITYKMRVSIMTERDTLLEAWSPFKHDQFPFIPMWGYRKASTGLPYSPTLRLMGPQDGVNHRMSRSLFEASANQVEMEAGAVNKEIMDVQEIRDELNAPDGIAIYADGALSGQKVRKRENSGAAQAHLALAEHDRMAIRSMVGTEDRGTDTSQLSGKARLVKADQTTIQTAQLFDNLLLARQIEGELTLSVAEQFMVHPFVARVAGESGGRFDRIKLNQPQPDGTYLNDITERRAHFVVGEQAWKQSYAESAFESLMQVMTQLAAAAPQVVINLLDVVFDMHPNLPRKKAVLQRIRAVNGQQDEDGKMTPEQQAEMQKKAQIAQAQFEAQMAQIQADIKAAQAKGEKLDAEAMMTRMATLQEAALAAQVLVTMAGTPITPVADELLKSVGFRDLSGDGQVIDPAAGQPAQPQAQQAQPMPPMQTAQPQQIQPMAPGAVQQE